MTFHTRIRSHEIGLRFRHGELQKVLTPGSYLKLPGRRDEVHDRLDVRFEHPQLEALLLNRELRTQLELVELGDTERALVFQSSRLLFALGAGRHAFWKQADALAVERFDIGGLRFEHEQLDRILTMPEAGKYLRAIRTDEQEVILLYRNGQFVERFGPGTYAHWIGAGHVTYKSIDLRERVLDVSGQEIMTADKVTLRVNLLVTYRIDDPLKSVSVVEDAAQATYREAQLALRAAVGTRSLDALLADKDTVADEVLEAVRERASSFGVEVRAAGLRDLILPGDMKSILNQVIEAQKQAEANLIRRREETAAARSQANTARLMAENPVLRRMKELEQLQLVLAGTRTTIVLGQGDITQQVRQMIASEDD